MSDWQPIETAPRDGTPFLAWAKGFLQDELGPTEDWVPSRALVTEWRAFAFRCAETGNTFEFTHWMPLPPPPEQTEESL